MTLDVISDPAMIGQYPAGVVTRPVHMGGAVSVEAGVPLTVTVDTEASRALIHRTSGWRLEKVAYRSESVFNGELVWWETATTDRSGEYLDAESRQVIVLDEDEHTHTYTTTLTVRAGDILVGEYVVGPYTVPTGDRSVYDLDQVLIPDESTGGTLVSVPELWAQIVADAQAVVALKGEPDGIAELDSAGRVPMAQVPVAGIASAPEVSAAIISEVDAQFTDQKGQPEGIAELDIDGMVPETQLPVANMPRTRVWDGTSYPTRIPGSVNFFLGPVDPGVSMDETDYYALPDVTTNAEVAAKVLDTSSDLHDAVRTATTTDRRQLTFNTTGAAYGSFSVSGVSITGWEFPDSVETGLHFSAPVPYGWNTARVRLYFASQTAGDVRLGRTAQTYRRISATPTAVPVEYTTTTLVAGRTDSVLLSGDIDLTLRDAVSGSVRRYGAASADTNTGTILVVHAELERVS